MENKMTAYAHKYVDARIRQVSNLRISADHKIEKLEHISKYVSAFKRGMITEEEMLWMLA